MRTILTISLITITCLTIQSQSFEKIKYWDDQIYSYCNGVEPLPGNHSLTMLYQRYGSRGSAFIELNANGDTVWERAYNTIAFSHFRVRPGRSIVASTFSSGGSYSLASFDSIGQLIQTYSYESASGSWKLIFNDLHAASDTTIYFAGYYRGIFSGGSTSYGWRVPIIGQLNPDLTIAWTRTYSVHNSTTRDAGMAYRIEPSGDGNYLVFGTRNRDTGVGFLYLGKFSPNGSPIWQKERVDLTSTPTGLVVSSNGAIYTVRNESNSQIGGNDFIVEKFTTQGDSVWCKVFGTPDHESSTQAAIDQNDHILIGGNQRSGTETDALLLKLDTNGNVLNCLEYGHIGDADFITDVKVTASGQYLMGGQQRGIGAMTLKTDLNGLHGCHVDTFAIQAQNYVSLIGPSTHTPYVHGIKLLNAGLSPRYYGLQHTTNCFAAAPCNVVSGISASNLTACQGDKITFTNTSTGQINDQWYVNGNTVSHGTTWDSTFTSTGSIQVKIISVNGACVDSASVTVQVLPTFNSSSSATICKGNTYNFHGNLLTTAGTYVDTLSAINSCDSVVTLNLNISNPDTAVTRIGNNLNASSNTTYQWVDCATGQAIPGATNQNYTATTNGSYRVIVTNSLGCVDSSGCHTISGVGIHQQQADREEITVYPNPVTQGANVHFMTSSESINRIRVYNIAGVMVMSLIVNEQSVNLNTEKLAAGSYTARIQTQGGAIVPVQLIIQ